MHSDNAVFVGKGETPQQLLLRLANRHGLIAGATGTGKTVSVKVLAEGLSSRGVPVFLADVKGDLSGISRPATADAKLTERARTVGLGELTPQSFPTLFWDIAGEQGHPLRTTISEMGPFLLTRLLQLNSAQEGVLNIAFKLADDQGLLLLDLKDLRAMLDFVGENASNLTTTYGTVSKASLGAIQRGLLVLEQEGADRLFGEPALDIHNFMRTDPEGRGYVSLFTRGFPDAATAVVRHVLVVVAVGAFRRASRGR